MLERYGLPFNEMVDVLVPTVPLTDCIELAVNVSGDPEHTVVSAVNATGVGKSNTVIETGADVAKQPSGAAVILTR